MATSEQWAAIQKALGTQLGGDTYSKVSMLSPSEIETVLKDTNTKNQTDALNSAQSNLNSLSAPYQQFAAANISAGNTYNQQLQSAAETTGYKQAQSSYDAIIQKGPMFELAMRPELAKVSPTCMGANPKDLDAKLTAEGITDPFTKQSMIQNYMQYADRSMTMSLSSLGQLYDSAVIAARTATEDKQKEYQKVADMYKEAYSATIMANKDWLESKINPKETGTNTETDFTDQEKRKLEQAGLNTASRQEQLDYLYGEETIPEVSQEDINDTKKSFESLFYDGSSTKADLQKRLASAMKDIAGSPNSIDVEIELQNYINKLPLKSPGWLKGLTGKTLNPFSENTQ